MIKTLVLCCFCCVAFLTKAQQKITTSKYPTYFGICASPVIPNDFIGAKNTYFEDSTGAMQTTFINKMGYTFGGIINGTLVAVLGYQLLRALNKAAGKKE